MPAGASGDAGSSSATAGSQSSAGQSGGMPSVSVGLPGRDGLPGADGPSPGTDSSASPAGRDSSTGDIGGQSGQSGSGSSVLGAPSGDYSLDTLPDGVLSGRGSSRDGSSSNGSGDNGDLSGSTAGTGRDTGTGQGTRGTGAMTTSEQAAILDEQLRRGYETFDGFILGERERAQAESNEAGSGEQPGAESGGSGGGQMPQILGAPGANGMPQVATQSPPMPGSQNTESFPPPEDIPSGRDDDVVARQLREAAMSEPDPELREALWDEYRNYTGLGGN
jgi:hypothetical protein